MKNKIKYGFILISVRIVGFFTRLKKDRVLFLSDVRKELGGNLKSMDDYISSNDYEKVYCLKEDRKVNRSVSEYLYLLKMIGTSKYILLDDFCSIVSFMKRKKGQEIVQLWHGPGAFKTFGLSRSDKKISGLKKYLTHRNYSKTIVTAEDIRWCYAEGFGMKKEDVCATGYPRTDVFFNKKYVSDTKDKIYKEYPVLKNKKVILFAPTYRGNSTLVASYDYDKLDLDKMYKELSKDYVFVFKWHPALFYNKEAENFSKKLKKYKDFYYDFSSYRDINDLLMVTDVLITDYSSVIFDYLLVNKPIVYYAYDLKEYENGRGLYYPFKDYVFGRVATNMDELIKSIKSEDMMDKERKEFNKKFMSSCDGNSTKKTYNMIFKK